MKSDIENGLTTGCIKHASLELTNLCNLECVHCYSSSSPRENISRYMKRNDWMNVIQDLSKIGCTSIQFIGGEPTVHPDLSLLIEYARQKGIYKIQVYTNGVSITDRLMDHFCVNRVDLAFSVYSYSPEQHDVMTAASGSHRKTTNNIKKAINKGLTVAVGIIVLDADDDIQNNKTIRYVESLGVDAEQIGVDRIRSFGRGKGIVGLNEKYSELCGRCWSERLAIDDEGNVYPCVMSKFIKLGHISSGLMNILNSDNFDEFHRNRPEHLTGKGDFLESSCQPGTQCRCPPKEKKNTEHELTSV